MTYRPVTNPGPRGRPPLPVDPRLVDQLDETLRTGKPYRVPIGGADEDQVDALVRMLRRAGYRYYQHLTLHIRRDALYLRYWLTHRGRKATP